jgi:NAD(P)-dependent dehydrogenase (short-subunit alcohol dehydrogenase family)
MGNIGQCNYAAAKAGIMGFTKSVAREVARKGVTANAIAPGIIITDMGLSIPEENRNIFLQQIPVGKLGDPEDIDLDALTAFDVPAFLRREI